MSPRSLLLATRARQQRLRDGSVLTLGYEGYRRWLPIRFLSGKRLHSGPRVTTWAFGFFALLALSEGGQRLRRFQAAPGSVQDTFFAELGRRLEAEREGNDAIEEQHGVVVPTSHHLIEWDEGWDRRARAIRRAKVKPEEDWTPDREADPLRDIPARVYVEALTGEEVPASGSMSCPLPDHEDRQPSFRVYPGNGWRCFGCGQQGSIYDLASLLWGVEPRGRGFVEIHKRLRAVFA